jgi:hypothetical protein
MLATVIIAGGCQPTARGPQVGGRAVVDDYRPAGQPVERRAPESTVVTLWRWDPTSRPASSQPTAVRAGRQPPRERPVEVDQVFVRHGEPVGFRRRPDGQLIAVAGPTTRALPAGHYSWGVRPGGDPAVGVHVNRHLEEIIAVGVVVLAVAGTVAAILAIDHNDRHARLATTIVNGINAPDPGPARAVPARR